MISENELAAGAGGTGRCYHAERRRWENRASVRADLSVGEICGTLPRRLR